MNELRRRAPGISLALVILAGLLLRVGMLRLDVRFHPDEALFAAQSRLVTTGDLLLRTTDLDKPPVPIYATALSFIVLGDSETAARLPNVVFSVVTLIALAALAHALYHDHLTTGAAVLLLAVSPYDLGFAATVFTDIQATFWIVAAAALATRGRWCWAGIAAALALACKPTAALGLPLIVALGLVATIEQGWRARALLRRAGRFALALATGVALLALLDLARAPRSFYTLAVAHNDPGRVIRADEAWPRLEAWGHWLTTMIGAHSLALVLGMVALIWLFIGLRRARSRTAALDWCIAGFALAFLGWYWLVAFNTYDRYLHPLVPFLLLLAARAAIGLWRQLGARRVVLAVAGVALATGILPSTAQTLRGDTLLADSRSAYAGIDDLAAYLDAELCGEVVYDHWLGWELAYYLGDSPGAILLYMPLPGDLADDMRSRTNPRYFAAPSVADAGPWLAALTRAGIAATPVYNDPPYGFVVYALTSPPS